MNVVTAVKYQGYLYLGYGDENSLSKQLGSPINIYQHAFTKFIAETLGSSMQIHVNSKDYYVEEKSLINHLISIGLQSSHLNEIYQLGYDAFINKHKEKVTINNCYLGENFSHEKRMQLFTKMALQVRINNTAKAKELMRKGAYLDREFYIHRSWQWVDRKQIENELATQYDRTQFFIYTPLALAIERGNKILELFISNASSSKSSTERQKIELEVTDRRESKIYWKTKVIIETKK